VSNTIQKTFNTVGVCSPEQHYMLPVLPRIPDINDMLEGRFYFVIHAPRQSGKTTFLKALTNDINNRGSYYALYCSIEEAGQFSDPRDAMTSIFYNINMALGESTEQLLRDKAFFYDTIPGMNQPTRNIRFLLNKLSNDLDKELIIFFDEADSLASSGPLITFLRQIRVGYNNRFDSEFSKFPRSLALIGMRDIGDYLTLVRPEEQSAGLASPFNIKKESLTMSNFTFDEIRSLYDQHTDATGQIFSEAAVSQAWNWTEGQPWLVNALAYETVVKLFKNDFKKTIDGADIDHAAHSLILHNDTHFESLKTRLKEPRVRRVIEAVVIGASEFTIGIPSDDIQYTVDLGLLKPDNSDDEIFLPANQIYKEIIIRTLSENIGGSIKDKEILAYSSNRFMNGTTLDMSGLLKAFQKYWCKNSEMYLKNNQYESMIIYSINRALDHAKFSKSEAKNISQEIVENITDGLINLTNEALTHLVLFAFLQRVLNGGADYIGREYALGTLRANVCVSYKDRDYPVELKIHGAKSREESLKQLYEYMNKSLAPEGWLVVFDKDFTKPWSKKIFWETQEYMDKIIHVVGC
jgi:hypothetical protein